MKENAVQKKSYSFAVQIVHVYQGLVANRREFVLSKQLLRSGTSIAANVEEAIGGYTRADFDAKMSIAYKETRETRYWLRLLTDTGYLAPADFIRLQSDIEELCRVLGAIRSTAQARRSQSLEARARHSLRDHGPRCESH